MEYNIVALLANIHNALAEINVRGDDAIRMAEVLRTIRSFVTQAQNSQNIVTAPEVAQENPNESGE